MAAITSRKTKPDLPTHVKVSVDGLPLESTVLFEQIKTIDKSRLDEYVGRLDKDTIGKVDYAVITSLGIKVMEELLK